MARELCELEEGAARVFDPKDEEGYAEYFREHGFVVVRDVLELKQVQATIEEIWASPSLLGGRVDPEDPDTWSDGWPVGCRNFLDPLEPCSEVETWRNRVNPAVNRVFDVLWEGLPELDSDEEGASVEGGSLVMSVDRIGVMRPTKLCKATTDGQMWVERPEWRTSRNWLHWDQNPWSSPGFTAVQGLLCLAGSSGSSGGFVTVPGFHREFAQWSQRHPAGSIPKRSSTMIPFPVPVEDEMQARRRKVLVPSGGLLVWDSRLPHENFPNEDHSWRIVQYVTCKRLVISDLEHRARAWHAGLRTGLVPSSFARRFAPAEQLRLGMAMADGDGDGSFGIAALQEAISMGEKLSSEALEAARKLRRAYRLKQTAELPTELQEATALFREAFAANPDLKLPLQCVAKSESTYLPFWLL